MAIICYKDEYEAALEALRPYGFNLMGPGEYRGTAREETAKAELKIRGLGEQRQRLISEIAQLSSHRDELKLRADTLSTKIARAEAEEKLMGTETTVLLQGWLPAERKGSLPVCSASTTALGKLPTPPRTSTRMCRSNSRTTGSQGR